MLVFGGNHNGINCIQKTDAERPCDKIWFTVKQIEEWSGMTNRTLYNRLNELEECERISRLQDLAIVDIPTDTGAVKTTIYNLNVLNQLAMVEMKNKVLNETAKKFSDILSEVETTGSYSVKPKDSYMIEDPIERAKAWIAEQEEHRKQLTLQAEQTARALEREAEAIRTKSYISDKKTATALGRVGGLVKENNYLKETLGIAGRYRTILAVANKNHLTNQKYISWRKLKAYCLVHELDVKEIPDERYGSVKAYPVEAFNAVYPELEV